MGIFTLRLIESTQKLGLRTVAAASKVYKHLLDECNLYLKGDSCICKVRVDFTSCDSLVALATSMLTSKPACMLNSREKQHIGSLITQAFLYSIPCNSSGATCFGRTVTIAIESQSVSDAAVFPGLLVDVPEMLQPADLKRLGSGPLKVVLFNTSLAGDISEVGDVALEVYGGVDPDFEVLRQLLRLGEHIVKNEATLFACQKVVHPVLQQYLREHGVIVIERLGLGLMDPFVQITGAQAVASLCSPVPPEAYGLIKGLSFQSCGSRELLQLLPCKDFPFSTMVLCHRNETMLEELKSQSMVAKTATSLGVSHSEFLMASEVFCSSLRAVTLSLEHDGQDCLIDLTYAHRWVPDMDSPNSVKRACGCGLVEDRSNLDKTPLNTAYHTFCPVSLENTDNQPKILDSFSAKLSALNVAVEIANLVLDLKYIIRDVN
ncbi:McKusick-Kaufman/Bardet-Biedl syndromes putative chaperonin [Triplophysa tibetana]|uniref:McKusick-Kaufman/Bardet-Biedl syndromes putative chaperonin n=1 Tax=Triplophysa tibetana TaxID=1572043 RepID=A0A5A9PAF2_9TELE|nr:McKusick-Kaufman/Bardet-Biedl syndromes putative chaperonin [Triplophysa tibetana]